MRKSKQLKIYLVDDDPFYLNIMKQITINLGYKDVSTFEDGISCLSMINRKPDVIFLDYQMDNLNGVEVLNKIKRYDKNIYVVMISGQNDLTEKLRLLKHDAFNYLQKNVNNEVEMKRVLQKITTAKEEIKKSKPSFFKKIFKT